jgi:type IV pilus assembly protein PilC
MPQFFYTAKSIDGEEKQGVVDVQDEREIAHLLHQEGYVLVSIEEQHIRKSRRMLDLSFGVSLKEKIFFCRNLQVMMNSGVSLPRALGILEVQAKNKVFRKALEKVKTEITKGISFSDALSLYPSIFSDFFRSMVKVGEETGTMENVLTISVDQMQKEYDLNSKVKGAMVYPTVIFIAMLGVGALMLVTIVPQLASTFKDMGAELPVATQLVIASGDFLKEQWLIVIGSIFLIVFGFLRLLKTPLGKRVFDTISLRAPIFSQIVKNVNAAFTVRNLSSLIGSGVSLPRALEVTSGTVGNVYYRDALLAVKEQVKKGEKFSDAIARYSSIYPITAIQMIAVGEETGETSAILIKLAEFYENEVSETTKNLTAIIEPLLMVVIGFAVGFFAISMIQPLYSVLQTVD